MRTIEIDTTQNVTIQYELAGAGERVIAYIIDISIIGACMFALLMFVGFSANSQVYTYVLYLVMTPLFIFYSLVSEWWLNGQSIGKKLMRLKVIRLTGKEPSLSDYLLRWCFRLVDIYFSLGSIASIMINSTQQAQRLGDLVANTIVVRLKPRHILELKDILKINTRNEYTPVYMQVTQLHESDLLVVKKTLERHNNFPNSAHANAIVLLCDIMSKKLKLAETPKDRVVFLKTLINDFVVLTR
ncbi:MAG TPA: RDD family protein [Bacteroidia bacterium]|nr:RDD family protein [Bacteroidia bacterium]HNU32656.1 RDD family protein [Bacteroidia bacterium]